MGPTVAVVIPARNAAATLDRAVASVHRQQYADLAAIAIAVGPSDDATKAVAEALARDSALVVVLDNPSGRTATALNLAIEATSSEVVARVDAGAELPAGYLRMAVETMRSTDAANVAAVQFPVGETWVERAVACAMRSRLGSGGAAYRHGDAAQPVDTGYLGVFDRRALESVGGFDADFIRNQDYELNVRLRDSGREVWLDPRLVVRYRPRGSYRGLARQFWQYGWWKRASLARHPHSLQLRQVPSPLLVAGLGVSAPLVALGHRVGWLLPGIYAAAVAAAASRAEGPVGERAGAAIALPIMHLSWGSGFLASATAALFRRR